MGFPQKMKVPFFYRTRVSGTLGWAIPAKNKLGSRGIFKDSRWKDKPAATLLGAEGRELLTVANETVF